MDCECKRFVSSGTSSVQGAIVALVFLVGACVMPEPPPATAEEPLVVSSPGQGLTNAFGTTDTVPEAVHCSPHTHASTCNAGNSWTCPAGYDCNATSGACTCRGDISGLVSHSTATLATPSLWAITDSGSSDRTVAGTSRSNSKYVFQMLNNQVTRFHLLNENINDPWNFHDPESIVRRNTTLGVVDGGNSWRDPPSGQGVEAGYCLPVTSSAGVCTIGLYSAGSTCGTRTSLTACIADTSCTWLAEPPALRGRIGTSSSRLRPYGVFRFTEPAVDTDAVNVETAVINESTGTWIRFRFPATCDGTTRPCGQYADLNVPQTTGHFNVEGAAITPGNDLVLVTKGAKRPEVHAGLSCTGGFWSTGGGAFPTRRVDEGDTHVFTISNFDSRAQTGPSDMNCTCTTTTTWRECTGCDLTSGNTPLAATYVTRFNTHTAPFAVPWNATDKPRVTAADADATGLYFGSRVRGWRVPLLAGALTATSFTLPTRFANPTALTSAATSCSDPIRGCLPELESIAVIGRNVLFSGEEDASFLNNMHNDLVTLCVGEGSNTLGFWQALGNTEDSTCLLNHGAWTGAASQATDRHGLANGAFLFSGGTSSYVSVPSNATFTFGSALSVQAWVRADAAGGMTSRHVVSRASGAGSSLQFQLHNVGAGDAYKFWVGTSAGTFRAESNTVPAGAWVKVTGTWDGATVRIYTMACTGTGATLVCPASSTEGMSTALGGTLLGSTEPVRIGHNPSAYSPFWGEIDEVRLYDCVIHPDTGVCQ